MEVKKLLVQEGSYHAIGCRKRGEVNMTVGRCGPRYESHLRGGNKIVQGGNYPTGGSRYVAR